LLKTLANVAGKLGSVPIIGDAAKIGSTVLNVAGGIASFFGWSKPTDPEFVTMVAPVLSRHMGNFNGDSKPKVLALDTKNTANVPTGVFNTEEDEMSFSKILSIPIFTDRFTLTGEQAQGSLLWKWPAEPGACRKSIIPIDDITHGIQRTENYMSYLSTCAMYWRGGIRYHLKCYKTSFHSARIRLTFVPGAGLNTDFATIDRNKCYSRVYDLRSDSDIIFTIPYTYFQPWKSTEWTFRTAEAGGLDLIYTEPQGMIYATVVNALRNPTTVENTVEFLVMVSGDDDFQFAVPLANPDVHVLTRAADVVSPTFTGRAQSGDSFVPTTKSEIDVNAMSIGEVFTGFRQWLKRYHSIHSYESPVRPFQNQIHVATDTKGDDVAERHDAFRRCYPLYRFQAGPMRVLMTNTDKAAFTVSSVSGAPLFNPTQLELAADAGQCTVENTYLEPIVELEAPFYQMWPALLTEVGAPVESTGLTVETPYARLPYNRGTYLQYQPADFPVTSNHWYRAIGESFSFGFLIGVPITVTSITPIPGTSGTGKPGSEAILD